MTKIRAYRLSLSSVMVVVMGLHVISGLSMLCANESFQQFRAIGIAGLAPSLASSDNDGDSIADRGGTSKCSCKKQKKCPTIPRAAITSNPTGRLHHLQPQAKSFGGEDQVAEADSHLFASRRIAPLMALAWCAPFCCSNPLALTSVLLI